VSVVANGCSTTRAAGFQAQVTLTFKDRIPSRAAFDYTKSGTWPPQTVTNGNIVVITWTLGIASNGGVTPPPITTFGGYWYLSLTPYFPPGAKSVDVPFTVNMTCSVS
jgi:hypothetical protein